MIVGIWRWVRYWRREKSMGAAEVGGAVGGFPGGGIGGR